MRKHRFVIVSGPSCAGKTPLKNALDPEFPEVAATLHRPVPYNSRRPRPGEVDGEHYHFRPRRAIERLRDDERYLVVDARAAVVAVDVEQVQRLLETGDVFYEGHVHVALALRNHELFADVPFVDVFVSPLSAVEIDELRRGHATLDHLVAELMRRRLLRRTLSNQPFVSAPDLRDIETRATAAYHDLQHGCEFAHVLPNHDGEDSDHWRALGRPVGDARRTLHAWAGLLRGERPRLAEAWPADLLPAPTCDATTG